MKKRIIYSMTVVLAFLLSAISLQAQNTNLDQLPKEKRDSILISLAREVYKNHPNFYREYGTPKITDHFTRFLSEPERRKAATNTKSMFRGARNGELFYVVEFPYDKTKDEFDMDYAAEVYIWEDTGKAFAIGLGNMMILHLKSGLKDPVYND